MAGKLHRQFNEHVFSPEKHAAIQQRMAAVTGEQRLRLSETPVFLEQSLFNLIVETGKELTRQALNPETLKKVAKYIPAEFDAPNRPEKPDFVIVDFAISRDTEGALSPKLIEMQAVTSFLALQYQLSKEFSDTYDLEGKASYLPEGHTEGEFFTKLRKAIVGNHNPRNVVLMDINPLQQLTAPDFKAFHDALGIKTVAVDELVKIENKLYYEDNGDWVEIKRIYNRIMNEEFTRLGLGARTNFKFTDDLDVEWCGHPHWYYLISKASMPYLDHPLVPKSRFLDEVAEYPEDLQNYVLKPLFAYGGSGVKVGVSREDLDAVPQEQRHEYLLMERAYYADHIENPEGRKSIAEVRVMYIVDGEELFPAILMGRLTNGNSASMTSSKFKPDDNWVGVAPVMAVNDNGLLPQGPSQKATPQVMRLK